MSLKFNIKEAALTSREIEAERDRFKTKLKKQKIILVTVAGAFIAAWVALYSGGFVSLGALITVVSGMALFVASAGLVSGVIAGAVAVANAVAIAIAVASAVVIAGAVAGAVAGVIPGAIAVAVGFSSGSIAALIAIKVTAVSIKINKEALAFLDDIDLEDCDEALELCNKYPQINEYRNKVVAQGRKLTKGEFTAMKIWADST